MMRAPAVHWCQARGHLRGMAHGAWPPWCYVWEGLRLNCSSRIKQGAVSGCKAGQTVKAVAMAEAMEVEKHWLQKWTLLLRQSQKRKWQTEQVLKTMLGQTKDKAKAARASLEGLDSKNEVADDTHEVPVAMAAMHVNEVADGTHGVTVAMHVNDVAADDTHGLQLLRM
eukprot:2091268-Amphidinium_carterae.3